MAQFARDLNSVESILMIPLILMYSLNVDCRFLYVYLYIYILLLDIQLSISCLFDLDMPQLLTVMTSRRRDTM